MENYKASCMPQGDMQQEFQGEGHIPGMVKLKRSITLRWNPMSWLTRPNTTDCFDYHFTKISLSACGCGAFDWQWKHRTVASTRCRCICVTRPCSYWKLSECGCWVKSRGECDSPWLLIDVDFRGFGVFELPLLLANIIRVSKLH